MSRIVWNSLTPITLFVFWFLCNKELIRIVDVLYFVNNGKSTSARVALPLPQIVYSYFLLRFNFLKNKYFLEKFIENKMKKGFRIGALVTNRIILLP